jgi:hypothetical protein
MKNPTVKISENALVLPSNIPDPLLTSTVFQRNVEKQELPIASWKRRARMGGSTMNSNSDGIIKDGKQKVDAEGLEVVGG